VFIGYDTEAVAAATGVVTMVTWNCPSSNISVS